MLQQPAESNSLPTSGMIYKLLHYFILQIAGIVSYIFLHSQVEGTNSI